MGRNYVYGGRCFDIFYRYPRGAVYGLVGNDSISTGQALLKVDTAKVIINILFGLMAALFVIGVALLVIGSIKHGDKTGYLARSKAKSATNSGLRPKR